MTFRRLSRLRAVIVTDAVYVVGTEHHLCHLLLPDTALFDRLLLDGRGLRADQSRFAFCCHLALKEFKHPCLLRSPDWCRSCYCCGRCSSSSSVNRRGL